LKQHRLELEISDTVLGFIQMDERKDRQIASSMGIRIIGTSLSAIDSVR